MTRANEAIVHGAWPMLSNNDIAAQIELACLLEATARKPGNVHPAAAFCDLSYADFVSAADAIAGPLAEAGQHGLGQAILNAIRATQQTAKSNVNLGIALLMAPLAAVHPGTPLPFGIASVLTNTTIEDAEGVYEAIRLSRPGGLGRSATQDVQDRPTITLRDAMTLAADRDRIAEQYATNFAFVTGLGRHWLVESWNWCRDLKTIIQKIGDLLHLPGIVPWEAAIIRLQLRILADTPDTLVVRKCGLETAHELRQRAADVHRSGWPERIESWPAFCELDCWMRADGHRRNPGTTADLIAAILFASLRDGLIDPPSRHDILEHATRIRRSTSGGNQQ